MPETPKKVAFLPAHPSQVWILNEIASEVSAFADTEWYMRDKEITLELGDYLDLDYEVISKAGRGIWGNGKELMKNIRHCVRNTKKKGIDLWVTKYSAGSIASRLCRKKTISFIDDDIDVVPIIGYTTFPFANMVITPLETRMGRFEEKTLRFPGNLELFYLHPNRFNADPGIKKELGLREGQKYAIIRLSALQAHHDIGIRGIKEELIREIIHIYKGDIKVFITSEKQLSPEFEEHRLTIRPERIHHALYFAEFFLGDSQTMTSEAAVLGTPAYRLSDFVGRLSYIEKLQEYGIAFGYKPGKEDRLIEDLRKQREDRDFQNKVRERRDRYIEDSIDPLPFFVDAVRGILEGKNRKELFEWMKKKKYT